MLLQTQRKLRRDWLAVRLVFESLKDAQAGKVRKGHSASAERPSTAKAMVEGPVAKASNPSIRGRQLEKRIEQLSSELAKLQADLGGLTYEMAIRDHFRLDLLVQRAAQIQELDAELQELDRLLRLEHAGAVGCCQSCEAPYSSGATYCWRCGTALKEEQVVVV